MMTMRLRSFLPLILALAGAGTIPVLAKPLPILLEPARQAGTFFVRGGGYSAALTAREVRLQAAGTDQRLQWLCARDGAVLTGESPSPARIHDLRGNDPRQWRRNVGTWSTARAGELYPGIDLVYHSREGALEFDLELRPRANARGIAFRLEGAELAGDGALRMAGGLAWKRPVAYQGARRIEVAFERRGESTWGFRVGEYDRSKALVIDPVLTYATYLGGGLSDDARGVAVDGSGNAYVIGSTVSTDYPGSNRNQTNGGQDIVVSKLNAAGTAVAWATYVGGSGTDTGLAIAVDAQGSVYGGGVSASTNFPVSATAVQRTLLGGSGITDGVVFRLSADGASILWATYLGGSQSDGVYGIAVDAAGSAFVTGRTDSTDFPNTNRASLPPGGGGDAFLSKLNADGSALTYSLVLGGYAFDAGNGVALGADGTAYVAGETRSENFPVTAGAYQGARSGTSDAFVAAVRPDGSGLLYSTYYGGEATEAANAIATDSRGNAYITGETTSQQLPTSFNAFQNAPGLSLDAFAARFTADGGSLFYGTYLGGDGDDQGLAIAVNALGEAYVAGRTNSSTYPLRNDGPLRALTAAGGQDGFLTKVNLGGSGVHFSTYLGGSGDDIVTGIAINTTGGIWLTGGTTSANLPVTAGVVGAQLQGATDGFVLRMAEISLVVTPGTATLRAGATQQFTASVSNAANTAVRWQIFPEIGTISQTGLYTAPASFAGTQIVNVSAYSLADGTKFAEASITLVQGVNLSVSPQQAALTGNQTQQFTANQTVTWSISPQTGSISSTGLYTAPAAILANSTVTVRAVSTTDNSLSATATVQLTPPGSAAGPEITTAGVANAASFRGVLQESGVSPGLIVTIFGKAMGPAQLAGLQLDGQGRVTDSLAGTRVLFDGTAAPLVYTSAGQLAAVVPYSVEGRATTQVQVEYEGRRSNTIALPVVNAAPGIFTASASGSGQGAILNQNGSVNSAQNAAAKGSVVVLYLTGEGATNPGGVDGRPGPNPAPKPKLPVSVKIGGVEAQVEYAGGAPGLVAGVLQVNVRVPQGVASGNVPVLVSVGSATSQPNVTVAVN